MAPRVRRDRGENRVLTNAHNVHRDETTCVFADGRRARGKLLARTWTAISPCWRSTRPGAAALPGEREARRIGSIIFAWRAPRRRCPDDGGDAGLRRGAILPGPGRPADRPAARATPRRWRRVRRAVRYWTARGACSGQHSVGSARGSISLFRRTTACGLESTALVEASRPFGRGSGSRWRPGHVARHPAAGGRPARSRRRAGPRRRGRQPGRGGGHP